MIDDLPEVL